MNIRSTSVFIAQMGINIQSENYANILELISHPIADINSYGRCNLTSLDLAIRYNKPVLVALFLRMSANPYFTFTQNSFKGDLEKLDPASQLKMMSLLGDMSHAELKEKEEKKFETAIRNGKTEEVKSMLLKGFPYSEKVWVGYSTPLYAAIQSGSFEIVEELVRRGSEIQDKSAPIESINQLLKLEKQRQIAIFEAFYKAPGVSAEDKLNACLVELDNIQQRFNADVDLIRPKTISQNLSNTSNNSNRLWSRPNICAAATACIGTAAVVTTVAALAVSQMYNK